MTLSEEASRDPFLWVQQLVRDSEGRKALLTVGLNTPLHERTPMIAIELERGMELLLNIVSEVGALGGSSTKTLMVANCEFSRLIDFLAPFDLLRKGIDYGFYPPMPKL